MQRKSVRYNEKNMNNEVEKFVKLCDEQGFDIGNIIACKSKQDKIKLKAHLKERIVHSEKINIIGLEVNFFVALLTLIVTMNFDWKETILGNWLAPLLGNVLDIEIINKLLAIGVCFVVFLGGVIWCCAIQTKKAKYTEALSYLEDYWDEKIRALPPETEPDLSVETFEQTRERYTKGIEQMVSELDEKRAEIDRQSKMWEAMLRQLRDQE